MDSSYDFGASFLSRKELVKGIRSYSKKADRHTDKHNCDSSCKNPYVAILAAYVRELDKRDANPRTGIPTFAAAVKSIEEAVGGPLFV